jgi:inosine-uridine nucleoside N-ribohydrolase
LRQTRAVPTTERLPIVLDCDPGHDDAVALAVAARHCDVRGVTTVAGNVGIAHTTHNALALVQLLGLEVPVHRGAAGPRRPRAELRDASHVHGESGLAGAVMPEVTRTVASEDAVGFLLDAAHTVDGLWIVATGPLTNVAAAIDRDPAFATRVAGISIMGGGTFGNVTPVAEFNVHYDPEAAAVVLGSGARLVVCGLDLTHQVLVDDDLVARLASAPNRFGPFAAGFLGEYLRIARTRFQSNIDAALHDPCAVLAITHLELFYLMHRPVSVETNGALTRGMTVVDRRPITNDPPNVQWAERIDARRALDVVADALTSAP